MVNQFFTKILFFFYLVFLNQGCENLFEPKNVKNQNEVITGGFIWDDGNRFLPRYGYKEPKLILGWDEGNLYNFVNQEKRLIAGDLLSDGIPVESQDGRVAFLRHPTDRYKHGVLGDSVEATALTVYSPATKTLDDWIIFDSEVIESLSPVWADVNNDDEDDLTITVSNQREGSRYITILSKSRKIVSSPPIGNGFRWRHLLAIVPIGPDSIAELIGVRSPHLKGIVESFHYTDSGWIEVANLAGYSTHQIGTRRLDMAFVILGKPGHKSQLILPSIDFRSLNSLERNTSGWELKWNYPLEGIIDSEIQAVTRNDSLYAKVIVQPEFKYVFLNRIFKGLTEKLE